MAEIQAYIAAFTFGLLVQGSIAAVFSYFQGHGSTIRKDGRRLVLVLFLIFAALWAQVGLVNFMIPFPNVDACQATVIASTFFDQAARITLGGFLLVSIGHVSKSPAETYGLGALMGIRIVAGVVFVGFARPQFGPLCVARSITLAPPITVLAMDSIIVGVLAIRVFTLGLLDAIRDSQPSTKKEQSKAFVYCTTGFFIWTLTSGAMLIGIPQIILLLRTGLPAAGLITLISIVTYFSCALVLPRDEDAGTPESRSPFVTPGARSLHAFAGESGSPANTGYMRSANLFVVNPSLTPGCSPTVNMPERVEADSGMYTKYPAELDSVDTSKSRKSIKVRNSNGRLSSGLGTSTRTSRPTGWQAEMGEAVFITSGKPNFDDQVQDTSDRASLVPGKERKRSIFGRSKQPAEFSMRQQSISKPVIIDSEGSVAQPFARVRTVDLATAAANERARREEEIVRNLIPMRPAPPPPTRPTSKIRRKTINERRSETSGRVPIPIITLTSGKSSFDSSRLSVKANASSTSSSLSPGREDVRRRSPRATKRVDIDDEKVGLPGLPPKNMGTRISENPLRRSVTADGDDQSVVMYVNDVVHDHPGIVKSIISGPPSILNKLKPLPTLVKSPKSPQSSTSILNRPRPYRRKPEKEGDFNTRERSPSHTRQKSVPTVVPSASENATKRKEVSTMPPSRLPTTASRLEKLLPNDTQSMTVEEKIFLLFPAPPGVHGVQNRRSSVPSLPRIPSSIFEMDAFDQIVNEHKLQERRNSKRRTISFGGPPLNESLTPVVAALKLNEQFTGHIVSQNNEETNGQAISAQESRQSVSSNSTSGTDESTDDSKSAWASIHSPIPAIEVTTVQKVARETYIQMRKQAHLQVDIPKQGLVSALDMEHETKGSGSEDGVMTVMLGLDVVSGSTGNNQIVPADSNTNDSSKELAQPMSDRWHRRIGDELPTFSQRRNYPRSRTASPPTPLHLYNGRRATVVERKPATATSMESPGQALMKIQSQLDNFEWSSTEPSTSETSSQPQVTSNLAASTDDSRLGLLADLEKEMNQQESHWMQMQHNFDRDSTSVIMTPRAPPSPLSDDSSEEISLTLRQRSRNGRNKNVASNIDDVSPTATRKLQSARSNMWQQRLAEAQLEYVENAPILKGNFNINFLSVSKPQQLGSPTPPESLDSASDSETDANYSIAIGVDTIELQHGIGLSAIMSKPVALWQPSASVTESAVGHLWAPSPICSNVRFVSPEPAAKSMRPAERRDQHSLPSLFITSTSLWSKPIVKKSKAQNGLWRSAKTRPKSIIIRPKTQRPQRKSKRVTFLPDILENPSPLPHKRDTLGIFQFPWGEKSDSAVYEPLPVPNHTSRAKLAMCSTLTAPSQPVDQELVEYSSSFFDDYDEEYDLDSINNSDDEFDETTLWDIASLLNSTNIPSKNSLLPPPRIIEDYDDTDDSDQDSTGDSAITSPQVQPIARPSMVHLPIQPLKPQVSARDWNDGDLASMGSRAFSNSSDVWQAFLPSLDEAIRAVSDESATEAPILKSDRRQFLDKALPSLPMEETLASRSQKNSNGEKETLETPVEALPRARISHIGLWTTQETPLIRKSVSLWTAQPSLMKKHFSFKSDLTIWSPTRKPTAAFKVGSVTLSKLTSTSLWALSEPQLPTGKHWLHITSLRESSTSSTAWQGSSSLSVKTATSPSHINFNTTDEMTRRQRASVAILPPSQSLRSIWTSPVARSNTVPSRKLQIGARIISSHQPLPLARVLAESAEEGQVVMGGQSDRGETTNMWRPKWGLPGSPREGLKAREGRTRAATEI